MTSVAILAQANPRVCLGSDVKITTAAPSNLFVQAVLCAACSVGNSILRAQSCLDI